MANEFSSGSPSNFNAVQGRPYASEFISLMRRFLCTGRMLRAGTEITRKNVPVSFPAHVDSIPKLAFDKNQVTFREATVDSVLAWKKLHKPVDPVLNCELNTKLSDVMNLMIEKNVKALAVQTSIPNVYRGLLTEHDILSFLAMSPLANVQSLFDADASTILSTLEAESDTFQRHQFVSSSATLTSCVYRMYDIHVDANSNSYWSENKRCQHLLVVQPNKACPVPLSSKLPEALTGSKSKQPICPIIGGYRDMSSSVLTSYVPSPCGYEVIGVLSQGDILSFVVKQGSETISFLRQMIDGTGYH